MLVLAYDKPEKSIAPPLRHCQTAQELDNPLHRHIRADWHAACVYHVIHMQYLQILHGNVENGRFIISPYKSPAARKSLLCIFMPVFWHEEIEWHEDEQWLPACSLVSRTALTERFRNRKGMSGARWAGNRVGSLPTVARIERHPGFSNDFTMQSSHWDPAFRWFLGSIHPFGTHLECPWPMIFSARPREQLQPEGTSIPMEKTGHATDSQARSNIRPIAVRSGRQHHETNANLWGSGTNMNGVHIFLHQKFTCKKK